MTSTAIQQLKLMYEQLFNLIDEIKKNITEGNTNDAISKATLIETLSSQIKFAKLGMNIPADEVENIKELEIKATSLLKYTTETLIQIKDVLKDDLNKLNNQEKFKNAYSTETPQLGQILYEEE